MTLILVLAMRSKSIVEFRALREGVGHCLNESTDGVFQEEGCLCIGIVYELVILNIISEIDIVSFAQARVEEEGQEIRF